MRGVRLGEVPLRRGARLRGGHLCGVPAYGRCPLKIGVRLKNLEYTYIA